MGLQKDIVKALRLRLLAAGIPTVVIGPIRENLDRAVGLTPYPVTDELTTGVSYLGVKVFIRTPNSTGADPAMDDQDTVYESLTSIRYDDIGGHTVAAATRDRSAPLGQDTVGRYLTVDTYYLITNR